MDTPASMYMLVAQSCLTIHDPLDCSPPGASVHEILQARILEWVAISSFRGVVPTQGLNPGLLRCRRILYHLSHQVSKGHTSMECSLHGL